MLALLEPKIAATLALVTLTNIPSGSVSAKLIGTKLMHNKNEKKVKTVETNRKILTKGFIIYYDKD